MHGLPDQAELRVYQAVGTAPMPEITTPPTLVVIY